MDIKIIKLEYIVFIMDFKKQFIVLSWYIHVFNIAISLT